MPGSLKRETLLMLLESQETAQAFLAHCYQSLDGIDAAMKSFENAQAFTHYIAYGQEMYREGAKMPKSMQPILFFYGACHMLKACLLVRRPDYPEQTSQLAHGVSARKRKRKDYTFRHDEVRIQHQGLFPYFSQHLFGIDPLSIGKCSMEDLLKALPAMLPLFRLLGEPPLIALGQVGQRELIIPEAILDGHQATWTTVQHRIKPFLPDHSSNILPNSLAIRLEEPLQSRHGPYLFAGADGVIYLPAEKGPGCSMHEVMIHYLLLYNLSMLSRYETEWWGDLFAAKPDRDYPLISLFLETAKEQVPLLIADWLLQQAPLSITKESS